MAKIVEGWVPTTGTLGATRELYEHEGKHFVASHSIIAGEVAIFEADQEGNIINTDPVDTYRSECMPFPFQIAGVIEEVVDRDPLPDEGPNPCCDCPDLLYCDGDPCLKGATEAAAH